MRACVHSLACRPTTPPKADPPGGGRAPPPPPMPPAAVAGPRAPPGPPPGYTSQEWQQAVHDNNLRANTPASKAAMLAYRQASMNRPPADTPSAARVRALAQQAMRRGIWGGLGAAAPCPKVKPMPRPAPPPKAPISAPSDIAKAIPPGPVPLAAAKQPALCSPIGPLQPLPRGLSARPPLQMARPKLPALQGPPLPPPKQAPPAYKQRPRLIMPPQTKKLAPAPKAAAPAAAASAPLAPAPAPAAPKGEGAPAKKKQRLNPSDKLVLQFSRENRARAAAAPGALTAVTSSAAVAAPPADASSSAAVAAPAAGASSSAAVAAPPAGALSTVDEQLPAGAAASAPVAAVMSMTLEEQLVLFSAPGCKNCWVVWDLLQTVAGVHASSCHLRLQRMGMMNMTLDEQLVLFSAPGCKFLGRLGLTSNCSRGPCFFLPSEAAKAWHPEMKLDKQLVLFSAPVCKNCWVVWDLLQTVAGVHASSCHLRLQRMCMMNMTV